MAGKSLADTINTLITTKPDFGSDEESEDTKAKVVEPYNESDASDNEFRTSKIRKQNIDTLDKVDKRYAGKKVSRKDIYSEDEDNDMSEDVENEEIDDTLEQSDDSYSDDEIDSELDPADSKQGSEDISDSEEQDGYDGDISNPVYKQKEFTIKTMSETNVKAEIEKGNCVKNQLKLWENFLEMRIKLQKCIVISNQMPQYDTHKELRSNIDFVKKVDETKSKLTLIIDNMILLKDLLLKQYPETKCLCIDSKMKKIDENKNKNINMDDSIDEEIPSDTEDELENGKNSSSNEDIGTVEEPVPRKRLKYNNIQKVLQENHDSYKAYRDSVIKKWNDKTRIAISSLKGSGQTTLKQIEFAMSDMNKLRKKTQLKRSEYNIIGKSSSSENNDGKKIQENDPEIYDDDDFYHQLLRDLIEYKSSDVTDPIQLSKQWIQLQNMRRKMKRKVDTRATKGRRVRYNIHNKLVNFMAPITVYNTWTDNAKNELYNSLFGKIKPTEEQIKQ
ncbi:protein AATF [Pogonomyrmex barbatus]|uniref:Protein AATF n=1 Tax=Pogonomyrmex barbatus TaxID=144034 RepID=A0A6I9W9V7_9HYME|nr:protein AATF [Pogonomyrmex barbatus]